MIYYNLFIHSIFRP